ncbi:MAG TPA: 16S rRNA (cytidine(1402)-2'-O)-methyltransferase [Longimicrobiales bacterium]
MATLYIVSTPIGNLEDVTRRAGRILGEVDAVLAEDTRRTGVLLRHLGVSRPLWSLHAHNEAERTSQVLERLAGGEDLALVSDAGTPLVSDPGERLVAAVLAAGFDVVPVPGPSAVVTALVASGLPAVPFSFLGFVPRKGEARAATLDRVGQSEETVVLFESPERLKALLEDLSGACGPERRVAVARELTKLHEEFFRGTLAEAIRYYQDGAVRGEVTVVVAACSGEGTGGEVDAEAGRALARALLADGVRPSHAAREVARRLGIPRNTAYVLVQDVAEG